MRVFRLLHIGLGHFVFRNADNIGLNNKSEERNIRRKQQQKKSLKLIPTKRFGGEMFGRSRMIATDEACKKKRNCWLRNRIVRVDVAERVGGQPTEVV